MYYLSHLGANVPESESSRERKFQGAKVPPMVLQLPRAKVRGNESSSYRGILRRPAVLGRTALFPFNDFTEVGLNSCRIINL